MRVMLQQDKRDAGGGLEEGKTGARETSEAREIGEW